LATKELAAASGQLSFPHFLFNREYLTKTMTVVPHPSYISLFPRMKVKLKGRHFDTSEVIEADAGGVEHSQNTTPRMHLKIDAALGTVHTRGRGLLQG
jgi:hypothetical protein